MNGKKYFGTASLFGSEYMAVYSPIMKDSKIIGILYVGYNYTKSFEDLQKNLKDIKIGKNVAIAANAVVNKSYEENNITIGGIPSKIISQKGSNGYLRKATEIMVKY